MLGTSPSPGQKVDLSQCVPAHQLTGVVLVHLQYLHWKPTHKHSHLEGRKEEVRKGKGPVRITVTSSKAAQVFSNHKYQLPKQGSLGPAYRQHT